MQCCLLTELMENELVRGSMDDNLTYVRATPDTIGLKGFTFEPPLQNLGCNRRSMHCSEGIGACCAETSISPHAWTTRSRSQTQDLVDSGYL